MENDEEEVMVGRLLTCSVASPGLTRVNTDAEMIQGLLLLDDNSNSVE